MIQILWNYTLAECRGLMCVKIIMVNDNQKQLAPLIVYAFSCNNKDKAMPQ